MYRRLFVAMSVALWLMAGSIAHAEEKGASAVIESLHVSLLAMMKDADTLGFEGRRKYMEPVVAQSFNMPIIAYLSTKYIWKKFNENQRKQLTDALKRLSVATFAARFKGYSGESFRVLSEESAAQDSVLVNTELVKADGDVIVLKYLLHQSDIGWRIIDVYFLGIHSELSMRRSEYLTVFQRDGFEGLLSELEQKTAEYAAGLLQ
jgi:phospholipid transport system substrate-binding protein